MSADRILRGLGEALDGVEFVRESNRIEGILRDPTPEELREHHRFLSLDAVSVEEMERFVAVFQPDAYIRASAGMNVYVGDYVAPPGGYAIPLGLEELLTRANAAKQANSTVRQAYRHAYELHVEYEKLHPFTDGNGRSGRMLWRWLMPHAPLGFLHHFYYQTLDAAGRA